MSPPKLFVSVQGQGSVSADSLNTFVQWCPNVTVLRSFIALPEMTVFVQGISVPYDGGAGLFSWLVAVSQPDDGANYIVPPGGGGGGWVRFGFVATIVADLPAPTAVNKGSRIFITDGAASPVFGAVVTGGGSLYLPAYSDGSNWRNG